MSKIGISEGMILGADGCIDLNGWNLIVRRSLSAYFRNAALARLDNMKTTDFYIQNWLSNKPAGLANYLKYNKNRK